MRSVSCSLLSFFPFPGSRVPHAAKTPKTEGEWSVRGKKISGRSHLLGSRGRCYTVRARGGEGSDGGAEAEQGGDQRRMQNHPSPNAPSLPESLYLTEPSTRATDPRSLPRLSFVQEGDAGSVVLSCRANFSLKNYVFSAPAHATL